MKTVPCVLFALLASVTPAFATVTATSPANGVTLISPVHYVASATAATCSKGVASMGVYVNNKLIYVVSGSVLNTQIAMSTGPQQTTVEEWDNCGGATFVLINVTVVLPTPPIVGITARSSTITAGSSSTVTVTSANSTTVALTGSDGTSYRMAASGGTQTVTPAVTTTYTVAAAGTFGKTSEETTVTVIPANSLQSVSHVVFMLQENHTFDNYSKEGKPSQSSLA